LRCPGEDIANELVDWFNAVAYRTELRELNELNFQRFDAKLEQRLAELRAELRGGVAGRAARYARQSDPLDVRLLGHLTADACRLAGGITCHVGVSE
jgi:hypothetical protein